jgi:gliding motility-associated-like protein
VINDITPPTALCQDITVQLDATGNVTIAPADVDAGSSDNCGSVTLSLDITSFDCSNIGPNTVTLTVEDDFGNQSTCTATVTVVDNIPPSITCPGDVAVTAAAGDCSAALNGIGPVTAGDNCSGTILISYRLEGATSGTGMDDASGTAFNKGVTTIWYKVTDISGNADSCSFDVTVLTTVVPPTNASSDPAEVCPGDGTITLSYSGGVMPEGGLAMWYDDAGLTNNIGNGNNLEIPAPVVTSTYYVRFEGSCDTSSAVSTTITVKSLTIDPVAANVDRSSVCAGDGTIILSYSGGDPGSNGVAVWYEDATFISAVGTGNNLSIAAPMTTTTYYVRFEADCDTSSAVLVDVTVWPVPEPVIVEGAANVCINGPLYRYVATGLAGSVFNWTVTNGTIVNDYSDSIFVDWGDQVLTGTVEVTETSVNGCISGPVTLDVEIGGPVLDLGEDMGTCIGTTITIDPVGTFATYLWQDGSTGSEFTTADEGWIVLEVADPYGCTTKDSLYLSVYDLPVVDLGPDTVVCGDEGVELDAGTDGIFYNWSTGDMSQLITVFYGGEEEIWVQVEDEYGCVGGDTVLVHNCSVEFFFRDIPTAITPSDGNGLNDFWEIDKLQSFSQAVVEIFDRWGTLVWRSETGYSSPWDGRNMRGDEVPMDSYHFVIDLNTGNKKDVITGIITVIR